MYIYIYVYIYIYIYIFTSRSLHKTSMLSVYHVHPVHHIIYHIICEICLI